MAYGNAPNQGVRSFGYDEASRLTCIDCGLATKTTYAYDGAGQRVTATRGTLN